MRDTASTRLLRNVKPYAISYTDDIWSFRWRMGYTLRLTHPRVIRRVRSLTRRFEPVIYVLSLAILGMMASSLMEGLGK